MKTATLAAALLISLASCANQWTGQGAALSEVVGKTQADIDGGKTGREYLSAESRQERRELEAKLLRAQDLKGTKAGDFHWAALSLLTAIKDVPAWATEISAEAIVLTPDGLAAWEQSYDASKKEEKKKKEKKKGDGPMFEGVYTEILLVCGEPGKPWRIAEVALDLRGPRFAAFASKKPFGDGAALSATEENEAVFDAALLAASPPFDTRALVEGFGGALATGDLRAFSLVAAPEGKLLEDLAARLSALSSSSQEVQTIFAEAPTFAGLPAGTASLKVALRGNNGQRLSYTIKKTKDGYRLTSLKARAKKNSAEIDLKPLATDPAWTIK